MNQPWGKNDSPLAQELAARAKRRRRRRRVWLIASAVFLAVAAILYALLLPVVARWAVERQLVAAGLSPASVTVRSISPWELALTDVVLGDEHPIYIGAVVLDFSPVSLWRGRIHSISLSDLDLTLAWKDGRLDLGPLDHLRTSTSSSSSRPTRLQLPVGRIDLFPSVLHLRFADQDWRIPVQGKLIQEPDGRIGLGMALDTPRGRIEIESGTTPAGTDTDFEFKANSPRFTWLTGDQMYEGITLRLNVTAKLNDTLAPTRLTTSLRAQTLKGPQFALSDVSLSMPLPVAAQAKKGTKGKWDIKQIQWQDQDLPGMTGDLRLVGKKLSTSMKWSVTPTSVLSATAVGDFDAAPLSATAKAELISTAIDPQDALAKLLHSLTGLAVSSSGSLLATVDAAWDGSRLTPTAVVKADSLGVRSSAIESTIDGLNAKVVASSVQPVALPAGQRIDLQRLRLGALDLTDVGVIFAFEPPQTLLIQRAQWSFANQGRCWFENARVDLADPVVQTDLFLDKVDLKQWIGLLSGEKLDGEGRVTGHVPLTIRPLAKDKIRFGEGQLNADPGGWLQVKDRATVEQWLAPGPPGTPGSSRAPGDMAAEVRQRAIDALQDFEYSRLGIAFLRENGQMMVRIQTSGKGRRGPRPQEIGSLVVNIRGDFEELLNAAILLKSGADRAMQEAVEQKKP